MELAPHGFSFLAFRPSGTSATDNHGLQENQGPGQPDASGAHPAKAAHQSAPDLNQPRHSRGSSLNLAKRQKIVSTVANVDYATGPYGAYNHAALHDSWVQGVIINVNWRAAEPSPGTFNFAPLDRTATAWADAGKHIVIVVRATEEIGGGCSAGIRQFLPGWEITALHKALGRIGTFCDKGVDSLVPDWFSSTFQSNFKTFIRALGAHVSARPYYSSISYVRIGDGLGGEGFFLFPQRSYAADKSWMEAHWHYTPRAWEKFQETMLGTSHAAFPRPVQIIYSIAAQDDLSPNDPVDLAVAKWATNLGGVGIGEQCLGPNGLNDYADFATIDRWVRDNHPNAYIQFQTCGQTTSASEEQRIIKSAEGYGAKSVEWYQNTIVGPPSKPDMAAYQTWVNRIFGN
jgi:hypothetical protein